MGVETAIPPISRSISCSELGHLSTKESLIRVVLWGQRVRAAARQREGYTPSALRREDYVLHQ